MYRILVSDKCLLFRDAVSVLISKHNENNIVIESDSLEHALKLTDHHENFDVVLITVTDPTTSNQLVDLFRKRFCDCK